MEVGLYCNLSRQTQVLVEGKKANAFERSESVQISTDELTIDVEFALLEGEGEFFGHISRSNRPFQKACKGSLIYEAFDWKIALRTLRRGPAKMRMSLRLDSVSHHVGASGDRLLDISS